MLVRNDSGETIPAYGAMSVTGATTQKGQLVATCDKPNGAPWPTLINSVYPIPDGKYGEAQDGPTCVAYFEYDAADPPIVQIVSPGFRIPATFGTRQDSWKLWKGSPGFSYLAAEDATTGFAVFQKSTLPDPPLILRNTLGVIIPKYSFIAIADTGDGLNGFPIGRAGKSAADGLWDDRWAFSPGYEVAVNEFFLPQPGPIYRARYTSGSVGGLLMGPLEDSFELRGYVGGFTMFDATASIDGTSTMFVHRPTPIQIWPAGFTTANGLRLQWPNDPGDHLTANSGIHTTTLAAGDYTLLDTVTLVDGKTYWVMRDRAAFTSNRWNVLAAWV
ncbi:MAG: hypothetical protein WBC44_12225 [Planctomycetaceae bacterium]